MNYATDAQVALIAAAESGADATTTINRADKFLRWLKENS